MNNTLKKAIVPILLILTITVIVCYLIISEYKKERHERLLENSKTEETGSDSEEDDTINLENLDYQAMGVLIGRDDKEKTITLRPTENGKDFLLEYDGTTAIYGKHGNSLSMDQLRLGDIVEADYSVHSKKLLSLSLTEDSWTMTDISKFQIDEKKKQMIIGDDTFKIDDDLVVSYGQELAELMDVTENDTLTVNGVDRKVCSIIVDRGHGYIRIKNDAYFVGGWLEVGTDIIKPITSEMLVAVPEGTYHVKVTNRGYAGQKDMTIERDKEEILDLDEVEIEEVAIGHVQFEIDPDYAQLYVDDEITDFEERVPLEFGIHKVHVEMAGYESVDTNIKVLSDYANVKISLEKESESDTSSSAGAGSSSDTYSTAAYQNNTATAYSDTASTSSSSSTSVVVSDTRQIYVESPTGAEVYLDGNYIGIAPTNTNKVTGQHVLTLSKSGYATKSYTINVDNDDRDVTFSFSDLIAE